MIGPLNCRATNMTWESSGNPEFKILFGGIHFTMKSIDGKNVNTKLDKSATLEKLICITPLNKNKDLKAKKVSKVEVKSDKSKPVTSCSTSKNEQGQKKNANVITRGMYRVIKIDTQTPVAKDNMFSCNSTRVASSSSVIRPKSKDTNSKKRVLLNTKSKSTSKDVKKSQSSVSLVSNKCDTMHLNVSESNTNVLKAKTVNVVHDGSNLVIQIFLWIVDSGVHMTVNLKLLRNFVEKFMGTVHFGNDNFAALTGYGDYVQGNLTICHVYYVEGLRHNLFLIGQLFVGDLEVAFNSNTCYVRNLEGKDLLTGSRDSNLYTICISEMATFSPI
ncbi:hypothetical protein Tco_1164054 [Tanacetum coccineum]